MFLHMCFPPYKCHALWAPFIQPELEKMLPRINRIMAKQYMWYPLPESRMPPHHNTPSNTYTFLRKSPIHKSSLLPPQIGSWHRRDRNALAFWRASLPPLHPSLSTVYPASIARFYFIDSASPFYHLPSPRQVLFSRIAPRLSLLSLL